MQSCILSSQFLLSAALAKRNAAVHRFQFETTTAVADRSLEPASADFVLLAPEFSMEVVDLSRSH